jgi:hypothetical protein
MDIPNHAELLDRIETFCRRHDMAETRFGREAVSNPNFISGLRKDPPVSPTLKTLTEVQDFMARTEAEAATRAKLDAAPDSPPGETEEIQLPFRLAPGPKPGASSPTSSLTNARLMPLPESDSCRSSPTANPSCSEADGEAPAEGVSVAAPSSQPDAAAA